LLELRGWFKVNEVPKEVMTGFLKLLESPHKLIGPVELHRFTGGAPDLLSTLKPSKRLKELVEAARAGALDGEQVAIFVKHVETQPQPELDEL